MKSAMVLALWQLMIPAPLFANDLNLTGIPSEHIGIETKEVTGRFMLTYMNFDMIASGSVIAKFSALPKAKKSYNFKTVEPPPFRDEEMKKLFGAMNSFDVYWNQPLDIGYIDTANVAMIENEIYALVYFGALAARSGLGVGGALGTHFTGGTVSDVLFTKAVLFKFKSEVSRPLAEFSEPIKVFDISEFRKLRNTGAAQEMFETYVYAQLRQALEDLTRSAWRRNCERLLSLLATPRK